MKNADVYAKVTASIAAALESGTVPWQRPWTGGRAPCNAKTLRPYSGLNVLALSLTAMERGYGSAGWVTFKQALEAGCVVRKGEKSTPVFWMSKVDRRSKDADDDDEGPESYFCAKLFFAFNVDQLADLEEKPGAVAALRAHVDGERREWNPIDECERVVRETGATIRENGDAAYYRRDTDDVTIPARERFADAAGYYATLFHELGHWTGAPSRLNRDRTGSVFGNETYAAEELVAELCAAYVSHTLGIEHVSQASAYVANWLKALRERPNAFVSAASAAQKAAEYILNAGAAAAAEEIPAAA